jgi:L-amino acid N-acyltransferase YncA
MSEMPIVVARRDGIVVGYALATSIAAKAHVRIIQTMLRAFPAPPNCYLYGPVCVTESERGNGLAGMMYQEMRARLPDRTAMSFVRSDNMPSLRANRKMGKKELGQFIHDEESYIVFGFTS